jgi:cyclophilin family peptidyl-prolyl cis-trans isomerase/predicted DsbA family dithiol-disulfide isomerase
MISACGAQPANLPTVTPLAATPTTRAAATEAAPVATEANTNASTGGSRPLAQMSPAQRSKVSNAPPPMSIDATRKYIATIQTSKGNIKVELDPSAAPQTVNNFVYLAQNGFYDGLTFHRVEPSFVIQGGDPLGNGTGGPGYNVPPEIKLKHVDGAIAMARTNGPADSTPNSGSQFYITIGAQPNLDGQYTVFGKTVEGQDVVRTIAVGDVIKRVDVVNETGSTVAAATPLPAPPATCNVFALNINKDDHVLGKADASVVIVEYADMQCPACAQLHPQLTSVFNAVSDTVQLVFRHFPLTSIHDKAQISAQAVEAASLQNKFWELHGLLYTKQDEWSSKPVTDVVNTFKGYAKDLGMDVAKFEKDLNSPDVIARISRDMKTAEGLQLNATPSIFINGRVVNPAAFQQPTMADQVRAFAQQRTQTLSANTGTPINVDKPDQVVEKNALYQLTLKTSKGDIQIELDPKLAPVNVNSTVYLVQKGYFNNSPVELNDATLGAVLLGSASRAGNPGYDCGIEAPAPQAFDKAGVVALLSDGQRNTTQFIITYSPTQQFDSQFSVIGHVTGGLDVVKTLQIGEGNKPSDHVITATVTKK